MSVSEFDIIDQYFRTARPSRDDVLLGIGDDCALLSPPPGKQLAISTDTLISGVHFPVATQARDVGYKSLAVNLSDLAAMGAQPAWASLALSLPQVDEHWLGDFMRGFNELAKQFNVSLIGGDTTRSPHKDLFSITINITGFIDEERALKRNRAQAGDQIFVTGQLGDAAAGLHCILHQQTADSTTAYLIERLNRPQPRVLAGQLLGDFSVAAIDISDGLYADLGHLCRASGCGAVIHLDQLPLSGALRTFYRQKPDWAAILNGGDDYELCFSCPPDQVDAMGQLLGSKQIPFSSIGYMTDSDEICCLAADGSELSIENRSYNHFNDPA